MFFVTFCFCFWLYKSYFKTFLLEYHTIFVENKEKCVPSFIGFHKNLKHLKTSLLPTLLGVTISINDIDRRLFLNLHLLFK